MGLEIVIPRATACPLSVLLEKLAAAGLPTTLAMVDNVLQGPGAIPPALWRDVRLRTAAGLVTLRRTAAGVAVVVFRNAGAELQAAQRAVAEAVRDIP